MSEIRNQTMIGDKTASKARCLFATKIQSRTLTLSRDVRRGEGA